MSKKTQKSDAQDKANTFLSRLIDISDGKGISPIYQAVSPEIEKLCAVNSVLPGSGNPLASEDPEVALQDLIGFKTVADLQEIIDSSDAVTSAFNSYFGASIKSFAHLVGEDTITATSLTKVYETRRADEVTEQNKLLTSTSEFQRRLIDAAGKLSIPLTVSPPIADKAHKKFEPFGFLFVPVDGKDIDHTGLYDWQTEPIFEPKSEDATLFERIYGWIFDKKLDPAVILANLAKSPFNTDSSALAKLFGRLYDLTNRQIDQSKKILTYIEKDFKMYQGCMDAGIELQTMIVEIGKFFGFTVGKASSVKKATK